MAGGSVVRALIGLGNPGERYARSRHNAGFWFADRLVAESGGRFRVERKLHALAAECVVDGYRLLVFKPTTYMNRSGQAVQAIVNYLRLPLSEVVIAHDDIDLPPGTVRFKRGGGHGGNNGLRDVIGHIGRDFLRLRIGVGHPGHRDEVVGYVLGRASTQEQRLIDEALEEALKVWPLLLREGLDKAMQQLHSRPPKGRIPAQEN